MSGRQANVPTMDDFNKLQEQVNDQQTEIDQLNDRVTQLEQGGGSGGTTPQPSPDGTEVRDTSGSIVDGKGRTFRLVEGAARATGYRIDVDGVVSGAGVIRLYAKSQLCYQENSDNDWWYMGDSDWVATDNPTGEAPPQPNPPEGTLFADEFESNLSLWNAYEPDPSKVWQLSRWYGNDWFGWKCNDGWMVNPWNPDTPYHDMYQLENGSLRLDFRRNSDPGRFSNCHFFSAQVNALSFRKRGGYWEGRMKCPNIQGTNMPIWLMSDHTWPPEVDIVELVNHGDWILMSQGVWRMDQTTVANYIWTPDFDPVAFHTYGFYWDDAANKMTFWFDGQKTLETDVPDGYGDPMFPILGTQQGGDWSGPVPDGAQMGPVLFDYIRCSEHPPQSLATAAVAQPMKAPASVNIAEMERAKLKDRKARLAQRQARR